MKMKKLRTKTMKLKMVAQGIPGIGSWGCWGPGFWVVREAEMLRSGLDDG